MLNRIGSRVTVPAIAYTAVMVCTSLPSLDLTHSLESRYILPSQTKCISLSQVEERPRSPFASFISASSRLWRRCTALTGMHCCCGGAGVCHTLYVPPPTADRVSTC